MPLNVLTLGSHHKGAARQKSRDEGGWCDRLPRGRRRLVRLTRKASAILSSPPALGTLSGGFFFFIK